MKHNIVCFTEIETLLTSNLLVSYICETHSDEEKALLLSITPQKEAEYLENGGNISKTRCA